MSQGNGGDKFMNRALSKRAGFTIIELMVAITVFGVLLALAVPSFNAIIRNNQTVAQNNEFVGALNYARSEALKRSANVTVCASADAFSCSGSTNWSSGWIVFPDLNTNNARDAATEVLLQAYPATATGFTLNSTTRSFVRYTATGVTTGTETFDLIRSGCSGDHARRIAISTTGRIGTTTVACP